MTTFSQWSQVSSKIIGCNSDAGNIYSTDGTVSVTAANLAMTTDGCFLSIPGEQTVNNILPFIIYIKSPVDKGTFWVTATPLDINGLTIYSLSDARLLNALFTVEENRIEFYFKDNDAHSYATYEFKFPIDGYIELARNFSYE